MVHVLVITTLAFLAMLAQASGLSAVNKDCIAQNSEELSNDFLLGRWYEMYNFSLFGGLPPSVRCNVFDFYKPTAAQLAEYKEKYNDPNVPYSMDDNPVIRRQDDTWERLVMGHTRAKFYVLEPKEAFVLIDGYAVDGHVPLADGQYMMVSECAQRGHMRKLFARRRDAPVEEMLEVIRNTPELRVLASQRFCAEF